MSKLGNLRRLGKVGALFSGLIVAAAVKNSAKAGTLLSKMERERSLMTDQRAIGLVDGAISLGIAAIVMGVVAMILSQIFPNIVGTDDTANTTIAAIKSTSWSAIGLLVIGLTVFAAVVIIGIVMYLRQ